MIGGGMNTYWLKIDVLGECWFAMLGEDETHAIFAANNRLNGSRLPWSTAILFNDVTGKTVKKWKREQQIVEVAV
jgi:hypothetical protein